MLNDKVISEFRVVNDKAIEVAFGPLGLHSTYELERYRFIAWQAASMSAGAFATLQSLSDNGPLEDGDVPSKSGRDELIGLGAATKVVVKGEDGWNACTHQGRDILRLRKAMSGS